MSGTLPQHVGHLIFFDGFCHMCNNTVQAIIRRDRKSKFYFAPIQSSFAQRIIGQQKLSGDTIIYITHKEIYLKSDAALHILKELGLPYSLLYFFKLVPKSARDGIYSWVAKNRYRWFGKMESCMIPTDAQKKRFIFKPESGSSVE